MSDEIHYIQFSKRTLTLKMIFVGDDYHTASVQFTLEAKDGRPTLNESVTIPVETLFDMAFLIGMSVRRQALLYETEVQEMADRIEQKKHPFESIGGQKDGKKD
jgi:hypothetical protein